MRFHPYPTSTHIYIYTLHIYCLNHNGKSQASMDTIYGMLMHDISGNAINYDIIPSRINKSIKINKNRSWNPFNPCILFETLNHYIKEHGPSI